MRLDNVFKKKINQQEDIKTKGNAGPVIPEGLLKKCNICKAAILAEDARAWYICPKCEIGRAHV